MLRDGNTTEIDDNYHRITPEDLRLNEHGISNNDSDEWVTK
jgi:hypothetical protein